MPRIVVIKAFVLNNAESVKQHFAVGVHEVEQWVADHWFTKAHLATAEDVANLKAEADELAAKAQAAADAAAALVAPSTDEAKAKTDADAVAAAAADLVAKAKGKKDSAADVL